jgi:YHS domain-containing protein
MLVKPLIYLLVGFLVYTAYQMIKQALTKDSTPPPEKTSRGEEMLLDPECGTYIPRNDAIKAQVKGATHYFCSDECRDKYQKRS